MTEVALHYRQVGAGIFLTLLLCCPCPAREISILNYNIAGIGAPETDARQALERLVDYFDPDIIIFQEAKGTANPDNFLAQHSDYEGFYSTSDDPGNRRMIMSKYDIVDTSVREYGFTDPRPRTIFAATIDLPGPKDLEVFTAHWYYSEPGIRVIESAQSVAIISAYQAGHPNSLYVYVGDFNEEDDSPLITDLLTAETGLNMLTPVDLNNGIKATINSDPAVGTYLDRRIDYILPSSELLPLTTGGRVLNTLTYPAGTLPPGLDPNDTVDASDHLPVYVTFELLVGGPERRPYRQLRGLYSACSLVAKGLW